MRILGALALLGALGACTPADPATALAQSIASCQNGPFPDQQLAACSAVVRNAQADPAQRVAALVQRGVLRAAQGQHARAIADYGRALRIDPTNTSALSERGAVHQQRGAYDLAVRDYDAALAIDPRNSDALYRRDQAMREQVDAIQQQIARLTEILTEEPENAAALNERCWVRAINDEQVHLALADCDAAVRIDARFAAALDSRGLVHLKRSEYAAALADYEAALAVEPNRGHYLYGRGLARQRLGQAAEGAADLVAAEAAEPGVARSYAGYGYIPAVGMPSAIETPLAAKP